jgi:hypothetical protein
MNTVTQSVTDIQVIAPSSREDLLAEARKGAANGTMIGDSSEQFYAEQANKLLGVEKWYVFNHDDVTDEGKIVNAEWKLLKAEYDKAYMAKHGKKYSNFSTVKARIRGFAEKHAKELGLFGEVPDVQELNEDDTPKGKAKHNKSVDERIMESTSLYMFLKRQEGLDAKQSKFLTYLANGLTEFGVNLAMIEASKK